MASCLRTCKTSLLAGFVNTARIPQALAVGVCQAIYFSTTVENTCSRYIKKNGALLGGGVKNTYKMRRSQSQK